MMRLAWECDWRPWTWRSRLRPHLDRGGLNRWWCHWGPLHIWMPYRSDDK